MKIFSRCITGLLFLAGIVFLVWLTRDNNRLAADVSRLEAELGRMIIDDVDRVYVVAIEDPYIPPEIASHVKRIWQYRLYLPAGYDVMRVSGNGRVAADGVYIQGSHGSGWSSPRADARQTLATISIAKDGDRTELYYSINGSAGSSTLYRFDPERISDDEVVIETLTDVAQSARSFDRETILPILKIYDLKTAEEETVADENLTTYQGGLIVLCPKSRESEMNDLRAGRVPDGFDASSIAKGVKQ